MPKDEKWLKTRIIDKLIVFMHLPAKVQKNNLKKLYRAFTTKNGCIILI